jgi:L-gulonate 5-dehydrogenase
MTKIPEKMKAAYLVQPRKFEIREVETPKICGERQVLVKTKAVGVCGSDLHAWNGAHKDVTMPAILGHEIVGEVVACGSAVTNVKVGDRVVREPIDYCGKCYACTHGRPNVCPDLKVWGFAHDGGHREYFVSECEKLYRFPDSVDWKVGAMIEPYTIAAEVNDRANICPGDTVMIHGLGPAGISVGDWAKYHGATVIASDVIPRRIATAQEFGLDYVLDAGKVNVAEEAMRITGGKGVNVLVDAAGFPGALDNALDLVSPGEKRSAGDQLCVGSGQYDLGGPEGSGNCRFTPRIRQVPGRDRRAEGARSAHKETCYAYVPLYADQRSV